MRQGQPVTWGHHIKVRTMEQGEKPSLKAKREKQRRQEELAAKRLEMVRYA